MMREFSFGSERLAKLFCNHIVLSSRLIEFLFGIIIGKTRFGGKGEKSCQTYLSFPLLLYLLHPHNSSHSSVVDIQIC